MSNTRGRIAKAYLEQIWAGEKDGAQGFYLRGRKGSGEMGKGGTFAQGHACQKAWIWGKLEPGNI